MWFPYYLFGGLAIIGVIIGYIIGPTDPEKGKTLALLSIAAALISLAAK